MNESNPNSPEEDETIEAQAALWIAQREEGFTEGQRAEFERWKNSEPKHAEAVAMVEKTCALFERKMPLLRAAPTLSRELTGLEQRSCSRPRIIRLLPRIGLAAAACLALAIGTWRQLANPDESVQRYTTTSQGYQRVALPDDSLIELNGGTDVHVRYTATERQVILAEGEAHFTVAKDPERPFVVKAGKVAVKAVGTAFNVRLAQAGVEVLVTHGKVQIGNLETQEAALAPLPTPDELPVYRVGQRVLVPAESGPTLAPVVVDVDAKTMQKSLSWQTSRLVFAETPLSEVVEQFNRRNQIQLAIVDPALALRPVGGSFRADQVESFVQLLEASGEIGVERVNQKQIILRTNR